MFDEVTKVNSADVGQTIVALVQQIKTIKIKIKVHVSV